MGRVQGSKDISEDRKRCIINMADAGLQIRSLATIAVLRDQLKQMLCPETE